MSIEGTTTSTQCMYYVVYTRFRTPQVQQTALCVPFKPLAGPARSTAEITLADISCRGSTTKYRLRSDVALSDMFTRSIFARAWPRTYTPRFGPIDSSLLSVHGTCACLNLTDLEICRVRLIPG